MCRRFYDIRESICLVVSLWTGCYYWLESYVKLKLKSSLHKFYGSPHGLVNLCMLNFLFENNSWHVSCLALWILFSFAGFDNDFTTVPLLGNANPWTSPGLTHDTHAQHLISFPVVCGRSCCSCFVTSWYSIVILMHPDCPFPKYSF